MLRAPTPSGCPCAAPVPSQYVPVLFWWRAVGWQPLSGVQSGVRVPPKEQPHFGEGGGGEVLGSPTGRGVMLGLIWAQDRLFQLKFLASLWGWCLLIALTEQRDFFCLSWGSIAHATETAKAGC